MRTTPSRVEVASIYMHQYEESVLGQKVAKAKRLPVFHTVGDAVMLGGKDLAVEWCGPMWRENMEIIQRTLKVHWLLPRWLIYGQGDNRFSSQR